MTLFSTETFTGKHVLITGATGGIGYDTAKVMAETGAAVTITGRKEDVLNKLADEIREHVPEAKVVKVTADLADGVDRERLLQEAEEANGPVDLLVNSAGIMGGGIVEELTQIELEKVMHLNYTVPILLTQQVYAAMKKQGEGAIVNVSSLSGLRGVYGGTAYTGSKFALNAFTQSFAHEAIEHKVRVNAVCPGYVDTVMGREAISSKAEREGHTFEEQYQIESRNLPSKRITTAREVAHTIAFLLSDAAENIIGETVKISGGSLM
ncbi:putative sugar dehydrogenase [Alkalibacterium sp. AK22]|uniref:SDR family NAD(P)-dependent oxidoreductase n=1 Tax=Alkalibacterium sp. AK22 TaxID=1229520 RepID=UPI00044D251D|nr:SDR family oxidoreductase [Alkalibacterium sp. AK22]EXJ24074.1 putative sugar dehydrogenase [Alkalibacterium sp. AK22]